MTAEADAMVSMSKSIEIETKMKGKDYADIIQK
jgi:uncharacterized protein (AIM24 family)